MRNSYLFLIIPLFALASCDGLSESSQNKTMFSNLALTSLGLEYPTTTDRLERCKQSADKMCLKTYELAKTAKQRLFRKSPTHALNTSLNTIRTECAKTDYNKDNVCYGAVTALYFFSTTDDDKQIMQFIANSSELVAKRIFEMNVIWLKFRRDKQSWQDWVNKTNLPEKLKRDIIYFLNEKKPSGLSIELL